MQDKFDIPKLPLDTRKMKLNKNILTLIGIVFVILLVLGFFGFQYIAPFGAQVVYQFTSSDKDKISILKRAESSENIDNNATNTLTIPTQTIRKNIVTFNLKLLSKKIDGVWVNLKFKGDPKELKIGVKGELKGKYTYQPLYQRFLESIKQEKFSDLLFWQKEKKYKNFLEFAKIPPLGKIIAVYDFDPTEIFSYTSPNTTQGEFTLNTILRGTHEMLVRVDNSPLTIDVKKQDQNLYKGPDALSIEVYKENKLIIKKEIPDDGIADANNLRLQPQEAKVELDNIENGIYRISLLDKSKGGDVRINSIKINQKGVVFSPPIFIIDDRPTTIFTDSSQVNARTDHAQGLQTLKISGGKSLEIAKVGTNYRINLNENISQKQATKAASLNQKLTQIDIPKNDLSIKGDGVFTFDKNSYFNPNPLNSTDISGITDTGSIDYVIARYQKVKKDGDWNIAQVYFDPKDINIDGDKLYFSLESPGLSQAGGEIAISSLEVTVNKPGWFNSANNNSINNPTSITTATKKSAGLLDRIVNFFKSLWPFGKGEQNKQTPASKTSSLPTPTPTLKERLQITVQNGGGALGIATKYADLIKQEGFKNVTSGNSSNLDYKNATISFNKDQGKELDSIISKIEATINQDYKIVKRITTANKDNINIILGEIPTPTPTASPSATIKH